LPSRIDLELKRDSVKVFKKPVRDNRPIIEFVKRDDEIKKVNKYEFC
jgi:hypothetical protein